MSESLELGLCTSGARPKICSKFRPPQYKLSPIATENMFFCRSSGQRMIEAGEPVGNVAPAIVAWESGFRGFRHSLI
jgi:hypothetical protein